MIERTHRLAQPSPVEIKEARLRANLTQAQALSLVSYTPGTSYRTWQSYEVAEGQKEHRSIPLATWELFLLLTQQHPTLELNHLSKASAAPPATRRADSSRSSKA